MIADIDRVADYFAQNNMTFLDAHVISVAPGSARRNTATAPAGQGIVIPLSGSAVFTMDGTPYFLSPGMVLHARPGVCLNKEVVGKEAWRYALVHYRAAGEADVPDLAHFGMPVEDSPRIAALSGKLSAAADAADSMAALRAKSLFHNLIEELLLSAIRRRDGGGVIGEALSYLHENYAGQFTAAELAARFGLSAKRFAAVFQRHTGMTPACYLTGLRIRQSKELLRTSDCPVSRVAEYVGYQDPYYYSRLFKKISGVSPTEFRAASAENVRAKSEINARD